MPGREADIHVAPWVSGVEELRCRRASRRARVHHSRSGWRRWPAVRAGRL